MQVVSWGISETHRIMYYYVIQVSEELPSNYQLFKDEILQE